VERIGRRERHWAEICENGLEKLGLQVFSGENQGGTVSFIPKMDCEEAAMLLAERGIAVRSGLHCAPLAHESAGTLDTGTVRLSFGHDASESQVRQFLKAAAALT
jgi:selenocysteine lyase/cysteine desulfurase